MKENYPKHIAIILDGNRRYGEKIGSKLKGHIHGAKKIEELISWCTELKIEELTLYSFSLDNFSRSEKEKKTLFDLFRKNISRLKNDKKFSKDKGIKISFIGRIDLFPEDILSDMHDVMDKTKDHGPLKINFAMAYSSKAEILDSFKAILGMLHNHELQEKEISEDIIEQQLYISSRPDIFIRPGGEKRMSDFLLWQSAYSELFFIDKLWPEFTKEDFQQIIEEFIDRERRFGK